MVAHVQLEMLNQALSRSSLATRNECLQVTLPEAGQAAHLDDRQPTLEDPLPDRGFAAGEQPGRLLHRHQLIHAASLHFVMGLPLANAVGLGRRSGPGGYARRAR